MSFSLGRSLVAGFVGAATVTIVHECLRKVFPGMPRLDRLGKEATSKTIRLAGGDPPEGDKLYATSMLADLVSNALYYSAAGAGSRSPLVKGAALGIAAGVGATNLPEHMNLNPDNSAGTDQQKWITIGLYTLGGVITGAILQRSKRSLLK